MTKFSTHEILVRNSFKQIGYKQPISLMKENTLQMADKVNGDDHWPDQVPIFFKGAQNFEK